MYTIHQFRSVLIYSWFNFFTFAQAMVMTVFNVDLYVVISWMFHEHVTNVLKIKLFNFTVKKE